MRRLHGDIMILLHSPLKTWGEPCNARVNRRCGVMTAAPAETGNACHDNKKFQSHLPGGRNLYFPARSPIHMTLNKYMGISFVKKGK